MAIQWNTQNSQPTTGIKWNTDTPVTPAPVQQSMSDKIWAGINTVGNVVNSIFPGKQVGQAIGTAIGAGISGAKGNYSNYDLSAPSPLQVVGDVAQGALTVAAPNVGGGVGTGIKAVGGRVLANTALGAGLGGTNAIAEGKDIKDVAKQTAIGGAIGGGTAIVGEGVKSLVDNLPKWLAKTALPKLDAKNIPYALENTKVGSIETLYKNSKSSMKSYESSIQSALNHPEHLTNVEYTPASLIGDTLSNFPNSEYIPDDILKNAKDIAPKVSKLISKFEVGNANIQEINAIRKELDVATKSIYTSLNRPPESKMLAAAFSNSLREFVKTNEPTTIPIFDKYAQEVGLNKALQTAVKKGEQKIRLGDIAAGVGGFAHSGWKGALEAIIAERLLLNPSAQLTGAKILQGASKLTPLAQGVKAPLVKAITNSK